MIYVFIKNGIQHSGLGRYALGMGISQHVKILYVEDLRTQAGIDFNNDIGVFAGFIPEEISFFLSRFKKTYYIFTSPLGQADTSSQAFYAAEIQMLIKLLGMIKEKRLTNLIVSSKPLAERLQCFYLPPVYICDESNFLFSENRYGYSFVGNNRRKHKNVVNTIAAISLLPSETIYVSEPNMYIAYEEIFNCKFGLCLEKDDRLFQTMLASHKLAFQCSYSESFNYLALEYAFHGVPCIVSPCIDWYPIRTCIVEDIDNPILIAATANKLLKDKKKYWEISIELRSLSHTINNINKVDMLMKVEEL